ncbi:MAG: hypothetical protein ABIJ56_21850 [Pseudomonadota bacterium]
MEKDKNKPVEVFYRVLFPERQEHYVQARAEKISYGGMLIMSSRDLMVESLIEIEMIVDASEEAEKLKLLAEVKWSKKDESSGTFSAGVFFLLPTAGRMFQLFKEKNLNIIRK